MSAGDLAASPGQGQGCPPARLLQNGTTSDRAAGKLLRTKSLVRDGLKGKINESKQTRKKQSVKALGSAWRSSLPLRAKRMHKHNVEEGQGGSPAARQSVGAY